MNLNLSTPLTVHKEFQFNVYLEYNLIVSLIDSAVFYEAKSSVFGDKNILLYVESLKGLAVYLMVTGNTKGNKTLPLSSLKFSLVGKSTHKDILIADCRDRNKERTRRKSNY